MSENETKESEANVLQEVSTKVAITPEDCAGAADFWNHFEVPMPAELKKAFENFAKDPSWPNQQDVKIQIVKAIGYTEHEAFADEMFKEIVEECRNVTYDMGFELSLRAALVNSEDKK